MDYDYRQILRHGIGITWLNNMDTKTRQHIVAHVFRYPSRHYPHRLTGQPFKKTKFTLEEQELLVRERRLFKNANFVVLEDGVPKIPEDIILIENIKKTDITVQGLLDIIKEKNPPQDYSIEVEEDWDYEDINGIEISAYGFRDLTEEEADGYKAWCEIEAKKDDIQNRKQLPK